MSLINNVVILLAHTSLLQILIADTNSVDESCGCGVTNRKTENVFHDVNEPVESSQACGKYTQVANVKSSYPRSNHMVFIKGGSFIMGTDKPVFIADGEGPIREVDLDGFYIDVYEVSNSEFELFVNSTGHKTDAESFGDSFVFESLLSKETKDKITQAVAAAPWWVPVKGCDWRHPEGPDSDIKGLINKYTFYIFCKPQTFNVRSLVAYISCRP